MSPRIFHKVSPRLSDLPHQRFAFNNIRNLSPKQAKILCGTKKIFFVVLLIYSYKSFWNNCNCTFLIHTVITFLYRYTLYLTIRHCKLQPAFIMPSNLIFSGSYNSVNLLIMILCNKIYFIHKIIFLDN